MSVPAISLTCPECSAPMTLRHGKWGQFYACTKWPACTGAHGAHPNGQPLGIPADRATKLARIRAHDAFDRLWKGGPMRTRKGAYRWMRHALGMTKAEAHIGRFTIQQCEHLIAAVGRFKVRV